MELYPTLGCALVGAGVVALLIPLILRVTRHSGIGRSRDFHHTHAVPVPRLGGLALAVAFIAVELFVVWILPQQRPTIPGRLWVILSSLAMFAVGFWDDLQALGARRKLLLQVLIALAVHFAGIGVDSLTLPFSGRIIELHGWGVILTVFWLVGITNLINLIDGVDGLAGGIALMLMALLVYVGHKNGTFLFLSAGITGSLLVFLYYNFPPARIYLGDGGAYLLGYQIAVFSLVGSHKGTVVAALIAPLFVLALPIVDTLLAILRRGLRGLPLFRPDRRHIHHRLLAAGISKRKVVLSLYGVTLVFLMIAFAVFWSQGQWVPVSLGAAVLALLLCAGRLSFTREWLAVGRTLGNSLAIRHEVQYALSLAAWLRHEGDRCSSVEELFQDLTFAAGRLGFTSIQLELVDGTRRWSRPGSCGFKSFHQQLACGDFGVLTVEAPVCLKPAACPLRQEPLTPLILGTERATNCPECPKQYDPRLCEIMSELLAESWVRAAGRCGTEMPLRFEAAILRVNGSPRRLRKPGLAGSLAPVTRSEPVPVGRNSAVA